MKNTENQMSKTEVREFLINGLAVIVDAEDYPVVSRFTWHIKKDKKTFYAYTNIKIGGKQCGLSLHRLLTGIKESQCDHINRNGLDNRKENLRYATNKENSCNRVRENKYGFRGVYKPKKSPNFSFHIQKGDIRIRKHGFKTAEDAAKEYDKLSKELHGEFGIRNFKD